MVTVVVVYKGFDPNWDDGLSATAVMYQGDSLGGGYDFHNDIRDLQYDFPTKREARAFVRDVKAAYSLEYAEVEE